MYLYEEPYKTEKYSEHNMFPPMICIKVMFMKHDSIFILTDFFHTSFVQNPVLTHIFIRHIAHIADSK